MIVFLVGASINRNNLTMRIKSIFLFSFFLLPFLALSQFTINACKKSPLYKENGGYKKTTFLNKTKVKKEALTLMVCDLLTQIENQTRAQSIKKSSVNEKDIIYNITADVIAKSNDQLLQIAKKLEGNKITNVKDYEKALEILKELRELKCRRIDPITQFLDKKINKIYGDISFQTGSSVISEQGKIEIKKIVQELKNDINSWRSYVNECNEQVFQNDLFLVVIDIDGYADQQGSETTNLKLSQDRAATVKLEIIKQLNSLVVNERLNIVFDNIQARGHGEKLPEGLDQRGENDPRRRICIINSLVGASSILK